MVVAAIAPSCKPKEPVYIGFAGSLSGRTSELGHGGRNGAVLAVNEINALGGVKGRKVELIVRDNRGQAEQAAHVTRDLIDFGCVAIIGHMLSQMSVEAVPELQGSDVVMISPTTATSQLNGIDDQFLRVYPDLTRIAERLARHAYRERGVKRMALLGDKNNLAFSQPWMESFAGYFREAGGEVLSISYFSNSEDASFNEIANLLLKDQPEGVLIIASAPDTGIICQQLRKLGSQVPVFTAEWSFAGDLLRYGGQSVEGLTLFHNFDLEASGFEYQRFVSEYREAFRSPPGFAAVNAYDATRMILAALNRQQDDETLKQALLHLGSYQGLQVEMRLDRFGDIERPLFLTRIVNGAFRKIETP